jgi:sensor histidine kinase YesM
MDNLAQNGLWVIFNYLTHAVYEKPKTINSHNFVSLRFKLLLVCLFYAIFPSLLHMAFLLFDMSFFLPSYTRLCSSPID